MDTLLSIFEVAPVYSRVVRTALSMGFADYENAVIHQAAAIARAVGLVTRNDSDFCRSGIHVYAPSELVAVISGISRRR